MNEVRSLRAWQKHWKFNFLFVHLVTSKVFFYKEKHEAFDSFDCQGKKKQRTHFCPLLMVIIVISIVEVAKPFCVGATILN